MSWYYAKNKVQLGPVDKTELDRLASTGEVTPDTLVWQKGMAAWIPFSQAFSPLAAANEGPDAACAECGQTFDKTTMIRHGNAWVCSACKPVFLQKLSEGMVVAGGTGRFGGFWIRVLAIIIDTVIVMVPFAIVVFVLAFTVAYAGGLSNPDSVNPVMQLIPLLSYVFLFFFCAAYSIFFVGKYGATPGKMVLKLQIVDASGSKIGFGRATGRFFAQILSNLTCYIGYIIAAFDPEKQSLHDRVCNTRVIYK